MPNDEHQTTPAEALAWLEARAREGTVEIARSLLGTGYEVGHAASGAVGYGGTLIEAVARAKTAK